MQVYGKHDMNPMDLQKLTRLTKLIVEEYGKGAFLQTDPTPGLMNGDEPAYEYAGTPIFNQLTPKPGE